MSQAGKGFAHGCGSFYRFQELYEGSNQLGLQKISYDNPLVQSRVTAHIESLPQHEIQILLCQIAKQHATIYALLCQGIWRHGMAELLSWWHHSGNFPSGFYFAGLPLFFWNRIAKILIYAGGFIIVLDIVGHDQVNKKFEHLHSRMKHLNQHLDKWRMKVLEELRNWLALLWSLLCALFSRHSPSQKFTQGRKSLPLAVTVILLAGFAATVAALFSITWLIAPHLPIWTKTGVAIFSFLFIFLTLFLALTFLLFVATAVIWLLTVAVLHPCERLMLSMLRRILHRVEDKTAAMSWRWASLGLVTIGFVLDFFTS